MPALPADAREPGAARLTGITPAGIALVFHRNPFVDGNILDVFRRSSRLPVVEPASGDPSRHGVVFLAPRDRHLVFDGANNFLLNRGPVLPAPRHPPA